VKEREEREVVRVRVDFREHTHLTIFRNRLWRKFYFSLFWPKVGASKWSSKKIAASEK